MKKRTSPRCAQIVIPADDRPYGFKPERLLHINNAGVFRGRDGSMTIVLPAASELDPAFSNQHTTVRFTLPDGSYVHFYRTWFANEKGYISDRNNT